MFEFLDREDAWWWLFGIHLSGPVCVLTDEGRVLIRPNISSKNVPQIVVWTYPETCDGGY